MTFLNTKKMKIKFRDVFDKDLIRFFKFIYESQFKIKTLDLIY